MKNLVLLGGLLLALSSPSSASVTQEPKPALGELPASSGPQDEMRELFLKIERNLRRMESYLQQAGSGDLDKLKQVAESGIDELLQPHAGQAAGSPGAVLAKTLSATQSRGKQVLEDIDRILELAEQNGGSCSNPGQGQPSGSPPQNQGAGETSRMQGNQAPEGKESGKPQEQGGQEKQESQGDPQGNQASQAEPFQGSAKSMPAEPTGDPLDSGRESERWGELPIYARDLFRAEGGRDLPPQYRDWIDAYYRRLNQRADGR